MFDIESKTPNEVTINTKKVSLKINVVEGAIDAKLPVGKLKGPGEFEIGDVGVRAVGTKSGKTIYDLEINGVRVGILGGTEENLDDIVADILCTSSVRAVREIEPKLVVAMGNVDGMVSELKLSARTEKKLKVKNVDSLPAAREVVVLN